MRLIDLISLLNRADPSRVVYYGFKHVSRYVGNRRQLALSPWFNTTVGEMLETARGALGRPIAGDLAGPGTVCRMAPDSPYDLDDVLGEIFDAPHDELIQANIEQRRGLYDHLEEVT